MAEEPRDSLVYRQAGAEERAALRRIWLSLLASAEGAIAVFDDLIARYDEGHRRYHTVGHLMELFDRWREERAELQDPEAVALAIFFHDAVYQIPGPENEKNSADLAVACLGKLGLDPVLVQRVAALILMTQDHQAPAGDGDAARFLDIDLAIIGAAPEDYRRYAADIRAEYTPAYDAEAYCKGRLSRFLEPCLAKDRLFHTEAFEARFGQQARVNLAAEAEVIQEELQRLGIT